MEIKHMEIGKVYYFKQTDYKDEEWLLEFAGNADKGNGLLKYNNCMSFKHNKNTWLKKSGANFGYSGTKISSIREATSEEIQWLEACIKEGKFIPKEEVIITENYSIF